MQNAVLVFPPLKPHFTILRELVTFGGKQVSQSQRLLDEQEKQNGADAGQAVIRGEDDWVFAKPLQALHINILREYLAKEYSSLATRLPFEYDFERIIDDFVFLCFFVGK